MGDRNGNYATEWGCCAMVGPDSQCRRHQISIVAVLDMAQPPSLRISNGLIKPIRWLFSSKQSDLEAQAAHLDNRLCRIDQKSPKPPACTTVSLQPITLLLYQNRLLTATESGPRRAVVAHAASLESLPGTPLTLPREGARATLARALISARRDGGSKATIRGWEIYPTGLRSCPIPYSVTRAGRP